MAPLSVTSMKPAASAGSSAGRVAQARTRMDSVPKRRVSPVLPVSAVTRAVTLSSACRVMTARGIQSRSIAVPGGSGWAGAWAGDCVVGDGTAGGGTAGVWTEGRAETGATGDVGVMMVGNDAGGGEVGPGAAGVGVTSAGAAGWVIGGSGSDSMVGPAACGWLAGGGEPRGGWIGPSGVSPGGRRWVWPAGICPVEVWPGVDWPSIDCARAGRVAPMSTAARAARQANIRPRAFWGC